MLRILFLYIDIFQLINEERETKAKHFVIRNEPASGPHRAGISMSERRQDVHTPGQVFARMGRVLGKLPSIKGSHFLSNYYLIRTRGNRAVSYMTPQDGLSTFQTGEQWPSHFNSKRQVGREASRQGREGTYKPNLTSATKRKTNKIYVEEVWTLTVCLIL